MSHIRKVLLILLLLLPLNGFCWQPKSHEVATRVAVRSLPQDVPAFFRDAAEELCYLVNEPDRWRPGGHVLEALESPNHWFFLERVQGSLPRTRYEFLLRFTLASEGKLTPSDLGTALYAMAEYSEMLTESFRLWRKAPDSTDVERRLKRQMEANIVHTAGVLAHYITDTAQPMHVSVHIAGWAPGPPNPQGYEGKDLHQRFEGFADELISKGTIEEGDIRKYLGKPKLLGDWVEEAEKHIRRNHKYLEQVYELDRRSTFRAAEVPVEAQVFTAERLAAGAEMLRDVWYSAWRKSKE